MKNAQNPPAFPQPADYAAPGMTLRDYFAGQALAALLAWEYDPDNPPVAAEYAYRFADAMLAERQTERQPERQPERQTERG